MSINRKEFFKTACLSGACLCGFGSLAFSKSNETPADVVSSEEEDKKPDLVKKYLGSLLVNLQENLGEEEKRKIVKNLALIHYEQLNMDRVLEPFYNNLEGFLAFLEKEWNWKVSFDQATQTIVADENKNYCVCPMLNLKSGTQPAAICYCSEGFAEKMFSKVVGKPVSARVISSIHRGNERCIYRIQMV